MNCWICGNIANSGEHMIKASDLRLFFPDLSQKNPIIHKTDNGKVSKEIGTAKSKYLHYSSKICVHCNNVTTSKHDKSWSVLSNFLHENPRLQELCFEDVWGEEYRQNMLNVHLYFVKQLGCAVESCQTLKSPIPLKTECFAESILKGIGNRNILLSFHNTEHQKYTALSDLGVEYHPKTGNVIYCFFFYIIGNYAVKIAYASFDVIYSGMDQAWLPYHNEKGVNKVKIQPFTKTITSDYGWDA